MTMPNTLALAMASLALVHVFSHLLLRRNLRALSAPLPPVLAGLYTEPSLERARRYVRRAGEAEDTFESLMLAVQLSFLALGGLGAVQAASEALAGGELSRGLVFLGLLGLLGALCSLPMAWWRTFRLDAEFGLNTTTWATFVLDRLKAALLTLVLGGLLAALVLWLLARFGASAWWMAWAVAGVFQVGLFLLAPRYLLPLFNRFTPLGQGPYRQAIEELAGRLGYTLSGVYVMDGSKRSTRANAFVTGLGRTKRISLFDTLMDKLTPEEIAAVLAHEIGHDRLGHLRQGMALSLAGMGLMLWCASLVVDAPAWQASFGLRPGPAAALVVFSLLWTLPGALLSLLANAYSRQREFAADAFARKALGSGQSLRSALEKLSESNLSNPTPDPWYAAWHYSHPPMAERLLALGDDKPAPGDLRA